MKKKQSYKLSPEQKKEIWKLFNEEYSPTEIAKKFDISRTTVYKIGRDNEPNESRGC